MPEPIGATAAASLLGVSRRRFYQLRDTGALPEPVERGPDRWNPDELERIDRRAHDAATRRRFRMSYARNRNLARAARTAGISVKTAARWRDQDRKEK